MKRGRAGAETHRGLGPGALNIAAARAQRGRRCASRRSVRECACSRIRADCPRAAALAALCCPPMDALRLSPLVRGTLPPPVSAALVEKQQASEQAATIVSQPLIAPAETEEEKRARQAAEKAMADPQVGLAC